MNPEQQETGNIHLTEVHESTVSILQHIPHFEDQHGSIANIRLENISNAHIDITQYLAKSAEYHLLQKEEQQAQEKLETTSSPTEQRILLSQYETCKKARTEFEQDVLRLAKTISTIEINTTRLKEAERLFKEGKFSKANEVLKQSDLEEDQIKLLRKREEVEKEQQQILKQLQNNANEFLVKAETVLLIHDNSDRVAEAKTFYRKALESYMNDYTLFAYSAFLVDHYFNKEAEDVLLKLLSLPSSFVHIDILVKAFNNLGLIYYKYDDKRKAISLLEQALQVRSQLVAVDRTYFLPYIASTLCNLGNIYREVEEPTFAQKAFSDSLTIYEGGEIDDSPDFLLKYATTLNNYGYLLFSQQKRGEAEAYLIKSERVQKKLITEATAKNIAGYGRICINLAIFYRSEQQYQQALNYLSAGIDLCQRNLKLNYYSLLEVLAISYHNLAEIYEVQSNNTKAISEYGKAIETYTILTNHDCSSFSLALLDSIQRLAFLYQKLAYITDYLAVAKQGHQVAKKLLQDNPDAGRKAMGKAQRLLGLAYHNGQQSKEAEMHLKKAVIQYASLNDLTVKVHQLETVLDYCNILAMNGKSAHGQEIMQEYFSGTLNQDVSPTLQCRSLLTYGMLCYLGEDYENAIEYLALNKSLFPKLKSSILYLELVEKTLYLLAKSYEIIAQYDLAIEEYAKVISLLEQNLRQQRTDQEKFITRLQELLLDAAKIYQIIRRPRAAIHCLQKALTFGSKDDLADYQRTLQVDILFELGQILLEQNQLNEAYHYFSAAETLLQHTDSTTSSQKAKVYSALGLLNEKKKHFSLSIEYFKKALKICRTTHSQINTELEIAQGLNNLGAICQKNDASEDAEAFLKEALHIRQKVQSCTKTDLSFLVAESHHNLGVFYKQKDDFDKGKYHYLQAYHLRIPLAQEQPHQYSPLLATTTNNLGNLYQQCGIYTEAERYYIEAIQLYRWLFSQDSVGFGSDLALSLFNQARLYFNQIDHPKALTLLEECLELCWELVRRAHDAFLGSLLETQLLLSRLFQELNPNKKKSVCFAEDVISNLLPFIKKGESFPPFFQEACIILKKWGLDPNERIRLLQSERYSV